jgi:hypothetical protein
MGIEPTLAAWEAAVLPLNYTRTEGRSSKDAWIPQARMVHARVGLDKCELAVDRKICQRRRATGLKLTFYPGDHAAAPGSADYLSDEKTILSFSGLSGSYG